jgi:hypothetical protein
MYPPVYAIANASAAVKAVFGTSPLRVWLFGESPQKGSAGYAVPYMVWQSINIVPENYLGDIPDIDSMTAQIDVYAATPSSARNGAQVLRDAFQQYGYVTSMREFPREPDTNLYRYQMDVDFWQDTNAVGAVVSPISDWIAPTLLNGWTNLGGGSQVAQYRRVGDRVDVRFVIRGGTALELFQLPIGYRPAADIGFSVNVHDKTDNPDFGHLRILSSGSVMFEHHGSLDNHKLWAEISFFISI